MHEKNAGAIGLRGPKTGSIHPWHKDSPYNAATVLWNAYETPDATQVAKIGVQGTPWVKPSSGEIEDQLNQFANEAAEAATGLPFTPESSGKYSSGSGYGSYGYGKVSGDMQAYIDMINSMTAANNQWAADQAQKQMDFQERMSRNAHRYEVEDLMAAGLNPVLSVTGGNGASSASGAMAQPDTTNSQLLANMAMQAVDSLGNSAVNLAAASGRKSANSFTDKLLNAAGKYVVPTLVRTITKGIFG